MRQPQAVPWTAARRKLASDCTSAAGPMRLTLREPCVRLTHEPDHRVGAVTTKVTGGDVDEP